MNQFSQQLAALDIHTQGGRQEFQNQCSLFENLGFQTFGPSNLWTFRPLSYMAFRPLGFQTIKLLGLQAFRLLGFQIFGPLGIRTFELSDLWAFRPLDFQALGILGYLGDLGVLEILGLSNFGPFEDYNFMKQNLGYPSYPLAPSMDIQQYIFAKIYFLELLHKFGLHKLSFF